MSTSIQKILVPVDASSCSIAALKSALSIAKAFQAPLYVHHVIENPSTAEQVKKDCMAVLGDFSFQYSESKGNVYKEIVAKSLDMAAGLIVMGSHGSNGFQEFWLGSNANKVVNSSKCPVLTVRDGFGRTEFNKIVLPMDTSFESRQKVPHAVNMAQKLKASIHVLSVSTSKDKEAEFTTNNYSRQAKDYALDNGIICTIEKRLGGNITNTTIGFAQEINADLIVIMTEQEPQIGSFFLGKFAQQMVNNSPVPVLVIPTRDDLIKTDARL
jgi:nucleotide-binding universal stress UspA family protein